MLVALPQDALAAEGEWDPDAARAEIARLRARVGALESWLAVAAEAQKVECIQEQRLAKMQAMERDRRYALVTSLPLVLALLYCAGVAVFVLWLLEVPL